jgi:carbonic anhydrase/acetyltransferase-like protein (isoleucine patch superfamily)
MGAIILNGARIGEGSIVAAGALVSENKEFPPRSLIVGIPAKHAKDVTDEQTATLPAASARTSTCGAHRRSLQRR